MGGCFHKYLSGEERPGTTWDRPKAYNPAGLHGEDGDDGDDCDGGDGDDCDDYYGGPPADKK